MLLNGIPHTYLKAKSNFKDDTGLLTSSEE